MATNFEETIDLTTCSVCFLEYDDQEHKPKFLSCHHTACLKCLKSMCIKLIMGETQQFVIGCPLCRRNTTWFSGGTNAEFLQSLPTNPYALHLVTLSKAKLQDPFQLETNWCLTCAALINPKCQKEHCTIFIESGKIKDAEALQALIDSYKSNLAQAVVKRKEIDQDLNALLQSIKKIGEELENDIETNGIELAKLASLLNDAESQYNDEPSAQSLKEKMEEQVEKSVEQLHFANDAAVRNYLRVQVDLLNPANKSILNCARLSNGFSFARSEIKNRPGLRSKLNLINHLAVSINKEEAKLKAANEQLNCSGLASANQYSSTLSIPAAINNNSAIHHLFPTTSPSRSVCVAPTTLIFKARRSKLIMGEVRIQTSFDLAFISALVELSACKPVISNHVMQAEPNKMLTLVCDNAKFPLPPPPMDSHVRALRNLDVGISVLTVQQGRLKRWSLCFLLSDLNGPATGEMTYFGTVNKGDEVLRSLSKMPKTERGPWNFILEVA